MPNTREKFIESCEREISSYGTSREMRFVGGDTPVIANGVTVNEWISVKDRLPEQNLEPVHDIDGIHFINISEFVLGCTVDGQMVTVQHEIGDERDWWMDYACTYYTITHWMPLPQPPKGE